MGPLGTDPMLNTETTKKPSGTSLMAFLFKYVCYVTRLCFGVDENSQSNTLELSFLVCWLGGIFENPICVCEPQIETPRPAEIDLLAQNRVPSRF